MLKSGVCTILWSSGHNLNQERIVFRHSISSSNRKPLFCMSSLFPFPTLMIPYFSPGHLSAPCSQVLLESALKHWSRVRRNVAQDGSGIGLVQGKQILDQPWRAFSGALPFPLGHFILSRIWCNSTFWNGWVYFFGDMCHRYLQYCQK